MAFMSFAEWFYNKYGRMPNAFEGRSTSTDYQAYNREKQAAASAEASVAQESEIKATGNQAVLEGLEKEYAGIKDAITDQYTSDAKSGGTYADTPEFMAGLNSDINAGVRGASVANLQRQNAIRAMLGLPPLRGITDGIPDVLPEPPSEPDQEKPDSDPFAALLPRPDLTWPSGGDNDGQVPDPVPVVKNPDDSDRQLMLTSTSNVIAPRRTKTQDRLDAIKRISG